MSEGKWWRRLLVALLILPLGVVAGAVTVLCLPLAMLTYVVAGDEVADEVLFLGAVMFVGILDRIAGKP